MTNNKLIALLFAATLCALAGCASGGGTAATDGNRAAGNSGGSGITVFGTVDAAVSGSRSR